LLSVVLAASGCSKPSTEQEVVVLKEYPMTGSLDVLAQDVAQMDDAVSADGNGAVRIHVDAPSTIRLYETGDLDVEDARVIYQARIRTEGVEGVVYLEMWCVRGQGEFCSRALQSPITGTTEWTSQETPFSSKGETRTTWAEPRHRRQGDGLDRRHQAGEGTARRRVVCRGRLTLVGRGDVRRDSGRNVVRTS
jgi:hypothetical protein